MSSRRLRLVVADLALLDAAIEGTETLSAALGGAEVTEGWSVFPQALPLVRAAVAVDPGSARWGARFFVLEDPRQLAGWGGFKGAPAGGEVELGYEIAAALRNQGLATAAVREMLAEAYAEPDVEAVIAHTRAEASASTRVLEKTGFVCVGEVPEPTIGVAWRWRRDNDQARLRPAG